MAQRKVSDIVSEFLANRKIEHIFGIIGAGNAHLFDSIHTHGKTQIVCTHHEQTATMAMQTYYRIRNQVTVALLTTGGGSTNGVTGVVGAWMDSMPSVIISGNENSKFTREDNPLRAFGIQGYDSSAMVSKVTKYSKRVLEKLDVIYELEKAFYIAEEGRPGPCWIDIPMDIQASTVEESSLKRFTPPKKESSDLSFSAEVLSLIKNSKRPLFWLGHGIRLSGATDLVDGFVKGFNIPALVSWTGIDLFDSYHPLNAGRAGVYGQRHANLILQSCDLLITIGTRLAIPQVGYDITEFCRDAKVVVVDIDTNELNKYPTKFTKALHLDAKVFMQELLKEKEKQDINFEFSSWIAYIRKVKKQFPMPGVEHKDKEGFINSYTFMEKLNHHLKPRQVIVTDMGTALLSGHQALNLKPPQRLLTSQGLGEMGFGLPGAIGASFADGKGEVLCLNCDGGMMMNLQELQTVVHHNLPIKIVVFNNDGYLMIKHTQNALFKGRRIGTDEKSGVSCPDFSKLATAFGITSWKLKTWEDFDSIIPKFLNHEGPAICEVYMHPEQLFVPKLSLASKEDGSLVSPPLEDLSPIIDRSELKEFLLVPLHEKSKDLK